MDLRLQLLQLSMQPSIIALIAMLFIHQESLASHLVSMVDLALAILGLALLVHLKLVFLLVALLLLERLDLALLLAILRVELSL